MSPKSKLCQIEKHYVLEMSETTDLVKRSAGPSLIPFEATNLNRLKIIHLEKTGIPCSI
jgi:hypothetical protein